MNLKTEWESVDEWYNNLVGQEGHYYHQNIILPKILARFGLDQHPSPSLLDLACGQGIVASHLPPHVHYMGIDLAPSLIAAAKKKKKANQTFLIGDICKPLPIQKCDFTHAVILLALQNVERPDLALLEASKHLIKGGVLAIVLNHPCFRIPRQSGWVIDETRQLQSRRIDHYMTPLKIPIQMHPGKGSTSETTWSFHHSLSDYSQFLAQAGFVMTGFEEWASDKKSVGKRAKMEDRARKQFPLFFTFFAQKIEQ